LLRCLVHRKELSRVEFEELAEGVGVLAEGAYEMLNEAAFEREGSPLLEGEDPVSIDLEVLGKMIS
jgi:hypothetical protein